MQQAPVPGEDAEGPGGGMEIGPGPGPPPRIFEQASGSRLPAAAFAASCLWRPVI